MILNYRYIEKSKCAEKNGTDYYPHGSVLPGRNSNNNTYRFGYHGQEQDAQTGYTRFDLRQFNTLLGRWSTPDPMGQYHSAYLAMGNNPVSRIDPTGGEDYEKSSEWRHMQSEMKADNLARSRSFAMNNSVRTQEEFYAHLANGGDYGNFNHSGMMNVGHSFMGQTFYGNNSAAMATNAYNSYVNNSTLQYELNPIVPYTYSTKEGFMPYTERATDGTVIKHHKNATRYANFVKIGVGGTQQQGGAIGWQVSGTFTLGAGYTVGFGYIGNGNGENLFVSYGPAFGNSISIDATPFVVKNVVPQDFKMTNFEGYGYSVSSGIPMTPISGMYGGDRKESWDEDSWPNTYEIYGAGVSLGVPLMNYLPFNGGQYIPGVTYSKTKTVLLKYPKETMNPSNPGLRKINEY